MTYCNNNTANSHQHRRENKIRCYNSKLDLALAISAATDSRLHHCNTFIYYFSKKKIKKNKEKVLQLARFFLLIRVRALETERPRK